MTQIIQSQLVSVVIPNYNYGKYLETCLMSVLSQDYQYVEVILVDDGSTDNSGDVAEKFLRQITFLKQVNKGVNSARNLGIRRAKGNLIALCDSDDYWESTKLSSQVNELANNPGVALIGTAIRKFQEGSGINYFETARQTGSLSRKYRENPGVSWIPNAPSTSLFYKEDAINIGLFDERLRGNAEDWEFFARLSSLGTFECLQEPLVNVRVHKTSRSHIRLDGWYRDNRIALCALQSKENPWSILKRIKARLNLELSMNKTIVRNLDLNTYWHYLVTLLSLRKMPKNWKS